MKQSLNPISMFSSFNATPLPLKKNVKKNVFKKYKMKESIKN